MTKKAPVTGFSPGERESRHGGLGGRLYVDS